jgi:hypothetical protein
MTMVNKGYIEGTLIDVTPTHYITKDDNGTMMWSREHYKLVAEPLPLTFPPSREGKAMAEKRIQMFDRIPIKSN